jgi:hypothetical protein
VGLSVSPIEFRETSLVWSKRRERELGGGEGGDDVERYLLAVKTSAKSL